MKKVAVLTTFMDFPMQYGLVPVVLNQLRMLVRHGYEPKLIVQTMFNKKEEKKVPAGVEFLKLVPFLHLFDFQPNRTMKGFEKWNPTRNKLSFEQQVKAIEDALEPILKECDVVITHDIIFQTWFILHNQAIRNIAKRNPKIKWLHWCHSGPSPRPQKLEYPHTLRHIGMPNSVWISPNESMVSGFAFMYNIPRQQIAVVYHTFDPFKFFDMHPLSVEIIQKNNLLGCDVVCVWATRMDAPHAKGFDKAIWLIAQMNKFKPAKLVFLNSWSNNPKSKAIIKRLREEGEKWGLPAENIIFSSEMGKEWEVGVPHKVVRDMLMVGNLFILPSQTETFSMAMVEASACKNLLVLNEDLTVMKELAGDNVLYGPFGSDWGGTRVDRQYHPNPEMFFRDEAKRILGVLESDKALMQHRNVLKNYTEEQVWRNQLEPLIEG